VHANPYLSHFSVNRKLSWHKIGDLNMKKKTFVIMSIFMLSTLTVMPSVVSTVAPSAVPADDILVYGTTRLGRQLDPHFAWDSASNDHQNQVVEGLFAYNFGSSSTEIIPRLAASCGSWNEDATEFTVPLRENVKFHDGTAFNASAVKWNFDRLHAFIEAGETMITSEYEPLTSFYPSTPLVIKEVVINSEFEVTFILNYPFAALPALLCFGGSAIMSPSSTPVDTFLDIDFDLLVGTGPFVHLNTTLYSATFTAYDEYYRGVSAVREMMWVAYEDTTTASAALLSETLTSEMLVPIF